MPQNCFDNEAQCLEYRSPGRARVEVIAICRPFVVELDGDGDHQFFQSILS